LSQEDAAMEAELDRADCGRSERGQVNVSALMLVKIAKVLKAKVGDFFPKRRLKGERTMPARKNYGRRGQQWHPDFVTYMNFITNHASYAGRPDAGQNPVGGTVESRNGTIQGHASPATELVAREGPRKGHLDRERAVDQQGCKPAAPNWAQTVQTLRVRA
jgi:DNA-binding XRE family transcriptional regulator